MYVLIYVSWKRSLKEETKTLKVIWNIWNTLITFKSSSVVGQGLNDCGNNHLNSGKRTEISIAFQWCNWDGNLRIESHSTIVWLTQPNYFRQTTIFNYVMLWYVKSSDFRAEEFALDYDHLRVLFTRSDFFSCSRGWRTILDALTYRYSFSFISLSLSQAEMTTIIPNMISRNHGNIAILCETQLGLAVLLRKNRDSTATDIHYRERTDLRTTAKEAIYTSIWRFHV